VLRRSLARGERLTPDMLIMAIEINNLSSTLGQVAQGKPAERPADGKGDAAPQSQPASGGDQVTLTPANVAAPVLVKRGERVTLVATRGPVTVRKARQLKALEEKVNDLPVVDSDRVNAVRAALASGSYEIDTQRIAGKLMSFERALSDLA